MTTSCLKTRNMSIKINTVCTLIGAPRYLYYMLWFLSVSFTSSEPTHTHTHLQSQQWSFCHPSHTPLLFRVPAANHKTGSVDHYKSIVTKTCVWDRERESVCERECVCVHVYITLCAHKYSKTWKSPILWGPASGPHEENSV